MDEPRRRFATMMSGLDIHYNLGEEHRLLGRRVPDLDLVSANGPLRVFTLLHERCENVYFCRCSCIAPNLCCPHGTLLIDCCIDS